MLNILLLNLEKLQFLRDVLIVIVITVLWNILWNILVCVYWREARKWHRLSCSKIMHYIYFRTSFGCPRDHRHSQDFVWGALFSPEIVDDLFLFLFLVVALKTHSNCPNNLFHRLDFPNFFKNWTLALPRGMHSLPGECIILYLALLLLYGLRYVKLLIKRIWMNEWMMHLQLSPVNLAPKFFSPPRVTNCPGTVPESRVCVPRPGQKQSGTIKCPGIGSTALIMVEEPLYLARVGMRLPFSRPNLMSTAFIWLFASWQNAIAANSTSI